MNRPERVPAAPQAAPTLSKVKDNHPVDNHSAAAAETPRRAVPAKPETEILRPLSTRVPQEIHDRLDYAIFTKQFSSRQEAVIVALDQLLPDLPTT